MATATITSKGQTTLPKEIREFLDVGPGDKIEFLVENDHVIVTSVTLDIRKLKGALPKPKVKVSLEDMQKTIIKRATGK